MYRFVVGTNGLNTSVDEFMTEEKYWSSELGVLPPNTQWQHVTVASEEDADAWLEAKNAWLAAAWEPNQSDDDRTENAVIMREAEQRMAALEIKE